MKIKVKVGNLIRIGQGNIKRSYIVLGYYQNNIILLDESKLRETFSSVLDVVKFIYQEDVSYIIEEYYKIDALLLKLKLLNIQLNILNMSTVTFLDIYELDIDTKERPYYTWHELNKEDTFYLGDCKILSIEDNILELKLGRFKRPLSMPIKKSAWYWKEEEIRL